MNTHSYFSNGPGSPLKVSNLYKNGILLSVFCIFRTLISQDGKVAQPCLSLSEQEFYVGRMEIN